MILDQLTNSTRYLSLHPRFLSAIEFLKQTNLDQLAPGRFYIDGDYIYGGVIREPGHGRKGVKLEAHRKYIDIHYPIAGGDVIGWKARVLCKPDGNGFDEEKDVEYFLGDPDVWIAVTPGSYAIFFPEDAHAPMAAEGEVHKIILKIALDS